ncbi:site-specific integrase [Leisingera sp. MMG025]|nr:tyrosine-type recombinase/integrase [Leisingera sp. MMG026]MCF6430916.1 site-specific integrase [Leisingera sp. MMG026]
MATGVRRPKRGTFGWLSKLPDDWGLLNHQTGGSHDKGENDPAAPADDQRHEHPLAEKTQKADIRNVKHFAAFLGRSPDTATPEELRSYQLKMTEDGVSASTFYVRIISLRFFFGVTCGREEMKRFMQFHSKPRKLHVVLCVEEVADLLAAVPGPGLRYRAALGISYGAGLRASEVCNLKLTDIDSDRMLIHVDDGKGRQDRGAMLSPNLLALLRDYWRVSRQEGWLFPGKPKINPLSPRQLNRAFTSAKHMAGINKAATLHTLRHSFATHLLEANTPSRQHPEDAPAGQRMSGSSRCCSAMPS